MRCPKCGGKNFNRVASRRRYRKFVCDDCGYSNVYLPYGNKNPKFDVKKHKKEWLCEDCELKPCYEYSVKKPTVCSKGMNRTPHFT